MTRHARDDAPSRPTTLLALAAAALVAALLAAGAGKLLLPDGAASTTALPPPAPPVELATADPPPGTGSDAVLTIVAGGDVLPHMPVLASARTPDGGHDFSPLLAGIDPWVAGADLALCHLEVPVVPPGEHPSGYPLFGTVPRLAEDLHAQGWDGCSLASNHSVDRGYAGVVSTLETFDDVGLGHAGTARSVEEAASPQLYVLERAGRTVTVAHLAATYGLNGLPMPPEAPWAVQLIDVDAIVGTARAAREAGADLVLLSLHAGTEYVTAPTAHQVEVADRLARSGSVDLVIGHHAHVPQPLVQVPGGPGGAGMWVAYGLGNLLSNQGEHCCTPRTDSGLLLTATVVQPPEGPARVTEVGWTGVTVDRDAAHRLQVLGDVVGPGARTTGTGSLGADELRARYQRVLDAVGDEAPERRDPPHPTGEPPTVVPRTGDAPTV